MRSLQLLPPFVIPKQTSPKRRLSPHFLGKSYSWVISPNEVELASAPDWLIALLPKHEAKPFKFERAKTIAQRCEKYLQQTPPAISGEPGHSHTFAVVCRIVELFRSELDDEELLECLNDWNERSEPPWKESELVHKIASARSKTNTNADTNTDTPANAGESANADAFDDVSIEFPILHEDAYQGLIGEIVKAIEPETEADAVGVLLSLLTACGNVIGRTPHVSVGADEHGCNLFCCLVGDTASGKGMAWNVAKWLLRQVDSVWLHYNTSHGLSSGEGLVERIADDQSEDVLKVPEQRRLLCIETEFAKTDFSNET